jgi:hypothetical protein
MHTIETPTTMAHTAVISTLRPSVTTTRHCTIQTAPITVESIPVAMSQIHTSPGCQTHTRTVQTKAILGDQVASMHPICYETNPVMDVGLLSKIKEMDLLSLRASVLHNTKASVLPRLKATFLLRLKTGHGAMLAINVSLELPSTFQWITLPLRVPSSIRPRPIVFR